MPLAFNSSNRGKIAFGFFNIDSDMLLLQEKFFFAADFCTAMGQIASDEKDSACLSLELSAYTIKRPEDIGDLMGAIHGVRLTGFIGETYRKYPFPSDRRDFKQKTEGFETRKEFDSMIRRYGEVEPLLFEARPETCRLQIGQYQFEQAVFAQLLQYVWQGGYPRWKDERRPPYVMEMVSAIKESDCWLFDGIDFS